VVPSIASLFSSASAAQCAHNLAGHWAYDLALHRNLLTVLEAERVALAATECSLVSPDRQHARVAA
jgi:hypothetical protein